MTEVTHCNEELGIYEWIREYGHVLWKGIGEHEVQNIVRSKYASWSLEEVKQKFLVR